MATLKELAALTSSTWVGNADLEITAVDDLESAGGHDVSFCANPRYVPLLAKTEAGAVCIGLDVEPLPEKNYLISARPTETFQKLIVFFLGQGCNRSGFTGIHPSAVIHPSARLGEGVTIGPCAVVDEGCVVGDHSTLGPGVVLGSRVEIGAHCLLHANVTVREGCVLGNRVIIQSGAIIGSCGFGYSTTAQGTHEKQEQLGIVILEDDVEVGANTTIDRGRFKATRIGKGTKIDNLVQIGHNTVLGAHNLIVSQTGISGSVKTGKYVVMGGQTGTVGHITVADGAMFAARSGIKKSILQGGKYGGNPAIPLGEHNREQVYLRRVKELEERVKELEGRSV